jgi:hypothetical protein
MPSCLPIGKHKAKRRYVSCIQDIKTHNALAIRLYGWLTSEIGLKLLAQRCGHPFPVIDPTGVKRYD